MTAISLAKRLRLAIEKPGITVMPAAFDGFSARLLEYMGYKVVFATGSGISESRIGQPDLGIMGLEENVSAIRAMAQCTNLAILADADTGYGNAVNAHFSQKSMERAGAAGFMLEDQVWPKRCGHMRGKEVIPRDEMVQKIRSAAQARVDPEFVIKSRTDALATHGIGEVIDRLNAYAEAGADLLFADALMTREQIDLVCRNVNRPLCVNMGFGIRRRSTTPLLSARQLEDLGVAVVIYPRLLTACALSGMKKGLEALHQSIESGETVERGDLAVSFEELNEIMGLPAVEALELRFSTSDQIQRKYGEGSTGILPPSKD